MKEIYLFRHGQTDWNLSHRMQGHRDIPLNQTGIEQAHELSNKIVRALEQLDDYIVYSSDLLRALKTCQLVLPDSKIHIDKRLREINIGEMEGMSRKELNFNFQNPDPEYRFKGGESIREHRERIFSFVEEVTKSTKERNIFLSTHGGTMARFLEQCENYKFKKIVNCELVKVKYEDSIFKFIDYL